MSEISLVKFLAVRISKTEQKLVKRYPTHPAYEMKEAKAR
jgi:hypothetical protein